MTLSYWHVREGGGGNKANKRFRLNCCPDENLSETRKERQHVLLCAPAITPLGAMYTLMPSKNTAFCCSFSIVEVVT